MQVIEVVRKFKGWLPDPLARLKKDHSLDSYIPEELVGHLEGLLGRPASAILELACVEGSENPVSVEKDVLLIALH